MEFLVEYQRIVDHPRLRSQFNAVDPSVMVVEAADLEQAFMTAYDRLTRRGRRVRFINPKKGFLSLMTEAQWLRVVAAGVPAEVGNTWCKAGDTVITEIQPYLLQASGRVIAPLTSATASPADGPYDG